MEHETALAKLAKEEEEKAKNYKCVHDVERVHHIVASAHLMRDYPLQSALAASMVRELHAANLKQADLDTKEREEHEKKRNEAIAADLKASAPQEEEDEPNPTMGVRAPSVPRR